MRTMIHAVLLAAAFVLAAPAVSAADKAGDVTDLEALRSAVQADKRGYVTRTLQLSDAEGRKFWPIYDQYQRARASADERRTRAIVDVVGRERPMSDAYAKSLVTELMAADEAEIKARRTLQNRLLRSVSARTAARYLQLESKIRAVEAYDIASSLPLVK